MLSTSVLSVINPGNAGGFDSRPLFCWGMRNINVLQQGSARDFGGTSQARPRHASCCWRGGSCDSEDILMVPEWLVSKPQRQVRKSVAN